MSTLRVIVILLLMVSTLSSCSASKSSESDIDALDESPRETLANRRISFEDRSAQIDELIAGARQQYEQEDYTRLANPVPYSILWLGCTDVYYNGAHYRMSDSDKEYLEAVVLNFEKFVERITDHNLDISIDLRYVDTTKELTESDGIVYLDQSSVREEINQYRSQREYDTVISTIECEDSILGLCTHGLADTLGYSTFHLGEPREGEYPLADSEIPSLYATSVAVHEWLHQLEYMGELLDVEYPNTHAYMGPDEYPGYQQYIADLNNYDFMEFYELVLSGKLPYTGDGTVKHVGMYPKMWELAKANVLNCGTFTICNRLGEFLIAQDDDPPVTLSSTQSRWILRYGLQGCFNLIPEQKQDLRLDLSNAYDGENNPVGLFTYNPWYLDAQRWQLVENDDGSYCIQTAYSSHRALTVEEIGKEAVIRERSEAIAERQEWIILPV